jgi:CBS domain-containing protein
MSDRRPSIQHIFRRHGEPHTRMPTCEPSEQPVTRVPTIADCVAATSIMSTEVVCAREDLELEVLVELMLGRRIGCLPVVDAGGQAIGMVTKQDLLELLAARRSDAACPRTAGEVMMPLAFTLDDHATVAHAAAMMASEGVHHVPIVETTGLVIGVVSSIDVVRWLAVNDGFARGDESSTSTRL